MVVIMNPRLSWVQFLPMAMHKVHSSFLIAHRVSYPLLPDHYCCHGQSIHSFWLILVERLVDLFYKKLGDSRYLVTSWRNGSASDSSLVIPEGYPFKSGRGHCFVLLRVLTLVFPLSYAWTLPPSEASLDSTEFI